MLSNDLEPDRHRPGAVHAASRRERLSDRRPDRLPARRRSPAARRQRLAGRCRPRLARGPGPGGRGPRRPLIRDGDARASGARGPGSRRPAGAQAVRVHARRGVRRPRRGSRTGYTGEPGVEMIVAPDKVGLLWDKLLRPARLLPGWARATRSGSRSAIRSTATTCRRPARRSRAGWAGSARSTARSSSAPRRSAPSGSRAATTAWSPSGCRGGASPARAWPSGPPERWPEHDVADARRRDRDGVRPADLTAEGTVEIDVRGQPFAARVAAKPLYVKEKVK